ncbi:uncharacterized protein LOC124815449 [Hydra vulgaris]|uniref:uncharacterized protein LOC124815449 n=1 Tax=Hydra vulgaris TaxID=6087 RepID=UPI001F5F3051|nr:uncharacterized protein LOC124815449 [Hydra vulgaris]
MDREFYEKKIYDLLEDYVTYERLAHNPMARIINEVHDNVDLLKTRHIISESLADYLKPHDNCRTPLFYGLPKVHKTDVPLRPIVSGCGGPTDKLAKYASKYLQSLVETLPAYLRDSTHLIQLLKQEHMSTEDYLMVTADVTSLYTNIPHEDGIEAVRYHLQQNPNHKFPTDLPPIPPTSYFTLIVRTILENSTFQFGEQHFHQRYGTAMGSRIAPPYANLFMGILDTEITNNFPNNIKFYKRFIDDLFFIFNGTAEELERIQIFMNGLHNSIKFTFRSSPYTIDFLDLTISKDSRGMLCTKLYRKPTDTMSLLHFESSHPRHQKLGLIYGQTLRFNRLTTRNDDLKKELEVLARTLVLKGYPLSVINFQIQKALSHSQEELVRKSIQSNEEVDRGLTQRIPIVLPNDPIGRRLHSVIAKHWNIVEHDPFLKRVFPQMPLHAYTNHKSLKDRLISTRFTTTDHNLL